MLNLWQFRIMKSLLFSLLLILASGLQAQNSIQTLTLNQAIDSALLNNRDIQLAQLDEKIAASKFKETNAVFLPQIDFSFTALASNNSLNVFGFKLQQQTVKQSDFNPGLLNKPGNASDFTTKMQLKQPVFNMDLLYMRKAAAVQTLLYQLKSQRTKEYLTYEVEKAYLQLQLSYDVTDVLKEALKTANAMYIFTNNRVQEGLLQKSDALNVKVWIATVETKLAEAKSNVENASDYLSLLMGRPYGITYITEKTIPTIHGIISNEIPAQRADFAAMNKALEASDLMIKSEKMSWLPRINSFVSYQYNDYRMFGFGADSYLAGVQLSWDIFKGNSTRNKIATQNIERNKLDAQLQNLKEQSQLELNKTNRQLADATYKIKEQITAVENAAEALRILQDRFSQGLVNTTDVLLAQTQLSQQKLVLAEAYFDKNTTAAYINFLTATTK
ncbi:MAG: TolC family protein [Bacteroidetes bacterium]|nr:TolC family protein [Bacteroidota bacterium]